jgi:orotate phosphoribosyltransferase
VRRYATNRKEIKTYADTSAFLGSDIKNGDRIILVDDVMTTGATKYEAVKLLRSLGDIKIQGLVIGLNRMELGENGKDAAAEFTRETGVPVWSIITARDVAGDIKHGSAEQTALLRYLNEYGISG